MKITATTEQLARIKSALALIHEHGYECKGSDYKCNAQRNLSGRTHYVDDDTLKWHKGRITYSTHKCDGLLFQITSSDALDMNNTRRGFRCIVFDVFGETVYRPDLPGAHKTGQAAEKACEGTAFDLVGHYQTTLKERLQRKNAELAELAQAVALLD